MSSGYMANNADIIHEDKLKKLLPSEFGALDTAMNNCELPGWGWVDFARDCETQNAYYDSGADFIAIAKAYKQLQRAFKRRTGLTLGLGYHDGENGGDCYDEINGPTWFVGDVWQRTPAGQKWQRYIENVSWVTWG